MPSLIVSQKLVERGVAFSKHSYENVGTVASRNDLSDLFKFWDSFRGITGERN